MKINNKNINISKKTFLRKPSKVMKLNRLGSFHQTRLSFCRQLVNQLKDNNWIFKVSEWNIDKNGIGNAIISSNDGENTYCLVVFCHPINDHDRSDRVIAEKWDMTFSLFLGEPTQTEIDYMSENLKVQEAGHHSSKQMTLSRANKSVRVFNNILSSLSKGKQPNKTLINDIGYLVRTTAVYGNGKFGIGDFDNISENSFLKKPFQAEMLTVYLIRFFSIKLINFLAKMKGGTASVKLSDEISKHIGVGNATGLGMAPFLINHPELLHKWINTRETAISRVYAIEKIDTNQQNEIVNLLQRALNYTNQWKVDDQNQSTRIKNLQLDLKKIIDDPTTKILLSDTYPLKNIFNFFVDQISLETEEILHSIFIEPFSNLFEDLTDEMGTFEKQSVPIKYKVKEIINIIQQNYNWALKININDKKENHFFWYTSQAKLEPRLGIQEQDHGSEKQLPFDIAHQVQNTLKILESLPKNITISEVMINYPETRNIIRRIVINNTSEYSEIQDNLHCDKTKPIDILRCKLSFFGASKYDPKSDLWTRITLFQGAPLPNQLQEKNACNWIFPYLSDA